jgi:predicted HAD superfamily Cof-like phosphohydrolase
VCDAVNDQDLEGVLDGLVDLVYVALGTALNFGLDFDEAWDRVQQANMEKVAVRATSSEGRHKTDVVKPRGWEPPSFKDLVQEDHVRPAMNSETDHE